MEHFSLIVLYQVFMLVNVVQGVIVLDMHSVSLVGFFMVIF